MTPLYGTFRATVTDNRDPDGLCRVQVSIPQADADPRLAWAMPCVPFTGVFGMPAVGANVWIEFEAGDPDKPIWVGCFWSEVAESPEALRAKAPDAQTIVLQVGHQSLSISDASAPGGGVVLRSAAGAQLVVSDAGIYINNGKGAKITLFGPAVDINHGALKVI